jgi:hypothetical protein
MLFKNFNIKKIDVTNTWFNANTTDKRLKRKELFITNY